MSDSVSINNSISDELDRQERNAKFLAKAAQAKPDTQGQDVLNDGVNTDALVYSVGADITTGQEVTIVDGYIYPAKPGDKVLQRAERNYKVGDRDFYVRRVGAGFNIPTPTTVEELKAAIEQLFEVRGKFERAWEERGDQRITFATYISGYRCEQVPHSGNSYGFDILEAYWPTPEQAVEAMWNRITATKFDIRTNWTIEMLEDSPPHGPREAEAIWWRMYPELITTKNKLYAVRMRAAFT